MWRAGWAWAASAFLVLAAASGGSAQGRAHGSTTQDAPDSGHARRALLLDDERPPGVVPPAGAADYTRRLRWGRALTVIGALMLSTGVAHLAGFAKNRCHEPEDNAPTFARRAGGTVAGIGFAMTFAGVGTLVSVPRPERRQRPKSRGARRALALGVVGGFLLLESFLLMTGMGELVGCASS